MLITLACGLLFTVGGFLGFAATCSFEGPQRPINQVLIWVTSISVAVTIFGLLWGIVEFVIFVVRSFKEREL